MEVKEYIRQLTPALSQRQSKITWTTKKGTGKSGSLNLLIIKKLFTELGSEELPVETCDMLD